MRSIHRSNPSPRVLATTLLAAATGLASASGPPGVPEVVTEATPRDAGFVLRHSSLPAALQESHQPDSLGVRFADDGITFARHGDWLVATGSEADIAKLKAWHADARERIGDTADLLCTIQHVPASYAAIPAAGSMLSGADAVGFLELADGDPTTIIDRRTLTAASGQSDRWPARISGGLGTTGILTCTSGDDGDRTYGIELELAEENTIGRRTDRIGHRFSASVPEGASRFPIVIFSTPFTESRVRGIDGSVYDVETTDARSREIVALTVDVVDRPPTSPSSTYGDLYRPGRATPDGIGRYFFGREIAQVMGHLGAGWLERESREREERTDVLLDHLDIQPGQTIADIGAGSGYYTRRLAALAGDRGRIVATDIQPEMLAILETRLREEGIENVEPRLGAIDDCGLAPSSVDLILLVDVYHEFDHPWEMMRSMRRSLRPGGRIALVEYRANDPRVPIKPLHTMTAEQSRLEFEAAGFELQSETTEGLPWQRVQFFGKRASGSGR